MELPAPGLSNISDLLLVNPAAGGGRARAALPAILQFARQQSWNVDVRVTQSPQDLVDHARCAAQSGRKRIFVLGGDGTFQLVVNAVANFPDIILGIIPAGGGNDLAAALGLPQDPLQAAVQLLKSDASPLDAAKVRFADGSERLFVGGGGVGLDAEASRYANSVFRNLRTSWTHALYSRGHLGTGWVSYLSRAYHNRFQPIGRHTLQRAARRRLEHSELWGRPVPGSRCKNRRRRLKCRAA